MGDYPPMTGQPDTVSVVLTLTPAEYETLREVLNFARSVAVPRHDPWLADLGYLSAKVFGTGGH